MERIRSLLFSPGSDPHKLDKVFTFGSDAVALDLEDAVAIQDKAAARAMVREAVERHRDGPVPKIVVRVNGPGSGLTEDDVAEALVPGVWGVHLTKLRGPEDIRMYDRLVSAVERRHGIAEGTIRFISSTDSAALVLQLPEMAKASDRMYCFVVGGIDFARDIGTTVSPDMREAQFARSYAVLASRAAGIAPPLSPSGFRRDEAVSRALLTDARQLGFQGGTAIHPGQVKLLHKVFTPAAERVEWARKVIAAFAQHEAQGKAAFMLEGDFVDYAVVEEARDVLKAAGQTVDASNSGGR